ncbi:carbon-nitrogen family hydrolase [Listeria costaricensis]|uniref:carbon-nitrogen family hydrolase n=1 Tax=Listeria costaricensis TaxID=2026604 RepID=UPI000C077E5F|nr:carbon-nitrogen family hydrolase [Listeria costaricensis]
MWKIALCQTDVIFRHPKMNFDRMEQAIVEAAENQADIVVFPEMWNTGYCLDELLEFADVNGEKTKNFLSYYAKKYHLNIIGGSVAVHLEDAFANVMYGFDENGDLISSYKKVHPFQLMDEHLYLEAGSDTNLFRIKDVPAAGFICYDIRFPEWLRKHSALGAEVLFVSAEWPEPRIDQWEKLLVARAIENQAFVVAVNRVGNDPANHFNGHSMVIDPHGEIILHAGEQEGNFYTMIDLKEVKAVRESMPLFADRRPELY